MIETVELYGASVRGPRNRREGRVNQDAWVRAAGTFGHLIGACDGVGSRPASDTGARAACQALRRSAGLWPGTASSADPANLVRLVEVLWRLDLAPRAPAECASTCAFALREPDGHLLLAGLGDGLAIIRRADGSMATFGKRDSDAFGNETLALGTPHRISDWWTATDPPNHGRMVVLVTDGVADDLDIERLDAFMEWLSADVGRLAPAARWRRLCRELRDWPVPRHVDDKTIVVLEENAGVAGPIS